MGNRGFAASRLNIRADRSVGFGDALTDAFPVPVVLGAGDVNALRVTHLVSAHAELVAVHEAAVGVQPRLEFRHPALEPCGIGELLLTHRAHGQKLFEQGWQAVGTSPDGMRTRVKEEAAIMTRIISTNGIKLQ